MGDLAALCYKPSAAELREEKALSDYADAYVDVLRGESSQLEFTRSTAQLRRANGFELMDVAAVHGTAGGVSRAQLGSVTPAAVPYLPSVNLKVGHAMQERYYYCGPAAVWMTLKELGVTTSKKDSSAKLGKKPTVGQISNPNTGRASSGQVTLDKKLKTTDLGSTAIEYVPGVLNDWLGRTSKKYVWSKSKKISGGTLTSGSFLNLVIMSLDAGDPVIMHTEELKGNKPRYNNHRVGGDRIGHFVVISAYASENGSQPVLAKTIKIKDPVGRTAASKEADSGITPSSKRSWIWKSGTASQGGYRDAKDSFDQRPDTFYNGFYGWGIVS